MKFPRPVRHDMLSALTVAAEGGKADSAKPVKGLGAGVFEITRRHNTDTYRTLYALRIGREVWVVHAFKKKSKSGIKTPKPEFDVTRSRIKWLKELLKGGRETGY